MSSELGIDIADSIAAQFASREDLRSASLEALYESARSSAVSAGYADENAPTWSELPSDAIDGFAAGRDFTASVREADEAQPLLPEDVDQRWSRFCRFLMQFRR